MRFDASCTSGGSVEASTTSAPAAERRDRDRDRRTACAQQYGYQSPRSPIRTHGGALVGAQGQQLGGIHLASVCRSAPGTRRTRASQVALSAFRATAVSSSHRIAELPGPTTSQ